MVGATAVTMAACCGCQRDHNTYAPPPPPKVVVATPVERPVTVYHEYTGTTQPSEMVQLRARVQGYIEQINFKDGVNVNKGDLLLVIDRRPYQALLQQAQADLQAKQATVVQHESVYRRTLTLVPSKVRTQEEADIERGNWLVAQANVAQAEAALRQAQLNLDYCEIHAPFAGRIGRRLVDIGNLISTDTILGTITRYDPMYVYFNVSETNYLAFLARARNPRGSSSGGSAQSSEAAAAGQQPPNHPVELGLADETGYPHKGVIDFLDNSVDPNSGTILVRGVFQNPPPYYLAPGLFARLRVPVNVAPRSLLIPDEALGSDQAGQYVMVIGPNNVAQRREVTPGEKVGNERVIEKGLKEGERIVVEGLERARPGEKVAPETAPRAQMAAKKGTTTNQ